MPPRSAPDACSRSSPAPIDSTNAGMPPLVASRAVSRVPFGVCAGAVTRARAALTRAASPVTRAERAAARAIAATARAAGDSANVAAPTAGAGDDAASVGAAPAALPAGDDGSDQAAAAAPTRIDPGAVSKVDSGVPTSE